MAGFVVITTIQPPGPCVRAMIERAAGQGLRSAIVGDRKTPEAAWVGTAEFIGLERQHQLGFSLTALLPENHYARKNIGYLYSMAAGGECIFDTDDDNAPLPDWHIRGQQTQARPCLEQGWVNAYRWYTTAHIWPRGLPLAYGHRLREIAALGEPRSVEAYIQQGLANGSPDVDAIWRLLLDRDFAFDEGPSVWLGPGCWTPFNSQSTWWSPAAYPLMYLPSFVSFRMTDIWRSFIAQRCLWALGGGVVFHGAEMHQDRNEHNLMRDFEQEVPGYLGNDRFREVLTGLRLRPGKERVGDNLHRSYEALIEEGLLPAVEMPLLEAWLRDLEQVR